MKFSEFVPLDVTRASAQQLALVRATFGQENTPETWVEMAELGYMALRNMPALKSIADQDLADVCVAQVYQRMSVMGGSAVYFPNGRPPMNRVSLKNTTLKALKA